MADIEERCDRAWIEWHAETFPDGMGNGHGGAYHQDDVEDAYRAGYMAGVAQTQRDYSAHYCR